MNLERALRPHDRLGGHFVLGHIDGTGTITQKQQQGKDYILTIETTDDIMTYVVEKGSIAIDGISLTLADVKKRSFNIYLIPHTLKNTHLMDKMPGDQVNLETDILGKYVQKFVSPNKPSNISFEFLYQ